MKEFAKEIAKNINNGSIFTKQKEIMRDYLLGFMCELYLAGVTEEVCAEGFNALLEYFISTDKEG